MHGLPKYSNEITTITPNGLDSNYFVNGNNKNNRFMYASAPNRGLKEVLLGWKDIKQAIPNAELTVYYGFTKSFMKYGKIFLFSFLFCLRGEYFTGLIPGRSLGNDAKDFVSFIF